ncbi:MAG: putative phage abortive infection protein [Cyclobacteriaceae bacterium]|nr:putative phage abortive infection protein [Cyclobacteriaceae bacterium]MCX7638697.1 putative phage abortive infection protein [Cyclobacteriaceae bacterium]
MKSWWLIILALVLWLVSPRILPLIFPKSSLSVEIVNSFFSAMAFAVLILTVILQKEELRLQREELSSLRKEFESQNRVQRRQLFESTFFNLIRVHHFIMESMNIGNITDTKGRYAIKYIYDEFKKKFNEHNYGNTLIMPINTWEDIKEHRRVLHKIFGDIYLSYLEYISHYLKNLVAMISFVEASDLIEEKDRILYYEILRAQLSPNEVIFLFYYFNTIYSHKKDYFNKLNLGQDIKGELLLRVEHSFIYDPDDILKSRKKK